MGGDAWNQKPVPGRIPLPTVIVGNDFFFLFCLDAPEPKACALKQLSFCVCLVPVLGIPKGIAFEKRGGKLTPLYYFILSLQKCRLSFCVKNVIKSEN